MARCSVAGGVAEALGAVIGPPSGTLIWLVAGFTDLRKGVDGLSAVVAHKLAEDPFSGEVYLFRGKRGDKIKILWATPEGMCFYYKRLNDSRFVWPQAKDGTVSLSGAQLAMLLEGIDWRRPKRTGRSLQDPDRTRPIRT